MNPACASRYIDLTRYPIDQPGSEALNAVLTRVREAISEDGCAVLPGFIRSTCISDFVEEAEAVAPLGHRSFNRTNAYFTADDTSLPAEHPVRRFYDRSNSFVPAENFGKDSPLRRVYE